VRFLALALAAALLAGCSGDDQEAAAPTTTEARTVTVTEPTEVGAAPQPDRTGSLADAVARVLPSVVNVRTESFGGGRGDGSGVVFDRDGIIITNNHVVEGTTRVTVVFNDDKHTRPLRGTVIGTAPEKDIAVIRVEANDLVPLERARSSSLRLGDAVFAVGYPLNLGGPTVTSGIVSALGRTIQAQDPNCDTCKNGVRTYTGVVQTDAAINPGNSGGPLVNLAGQVVGINTAGANQAENIGFAIATNEARPIIDEAAANPSAPVAYLGVTTQDVNPSLALQFGLPVQSGALVLDVVPGGPAGRAGIGQGDVIVGLDGEDVTDSTSLRELILSHRPGDRVAIGVVTEGGQTETIIATLGVNPLPQT
jgi:S1-C subfamily serine protease